jgi:hypothetical protein
MVRATNRCSYLVALVSLEWKEGRKEGKVAHLLILRLRLRPSIEEED